jgi:hypothetical protein
MLIVSKKVLLRNAEKGRKNSEEERPVLLPVIG